MRRLRSHLTYANVVATLALVAAAGGGVAYAANTVFSGDIVDGEVKSPDLASNAVGTGKIANNQVFSDDVRDDTLAGGGLAAADLRSESVGPAEAAGLTGADIADAASGSDDVNADKLDGLNSSGLVKGRGKLLAGRYMMLPDPGGTSLSRTLLEIPGFGRLDARCEFDNAHIVFTNTTSGAVDFWIDAGGTPSHQVIQSLFTSIVASTDGAEASTVGLGFGDDPGARKTATVHPSVAQVGANDACIFQAQGMLWTSG